MHVVALAHPDAAGGSGVGGPDAPGGITARDALTAAVARAAAALAGGLAVSLAREDRLPLPHDRHRTPNGARRAAA